MFEVGCNAVLLLHRKRHRVQKTKKVNHLTESRVPSDDEQDTNQCGPSNNEPQTHF
jgi:hypothetical protein